MIDWLMSMGDETGGERWCVSSVERPLTAINDQVFRTCALTHELQLDVSCSVNQPLASKRHKNLCTATKFGFCSLPKRETKRLLRTYYVQRSVPPAINCENRVTRGESSFIITIIISSSYW